MNDQYVPPIATTALRPPDEPYDWDEHSTCPGFTVGRRVLIAEDDPALRQLMAHILAFEGYFVTEAADAKAMLEAVSGTRRDSEPPFDLIVTDVRMPGQSGLDALASLRKSGCRTPAIVVSALPGEQVRDEAEELEALFLPKPFALENLRRIANRVVSDHEERELSTP